MMRSFSSERAQLIIMTSSTLRCRWSSRDLNKYLEVWTQAYSDYLFTAHSQVHFNKWFYGLFYPNACKFKRSTIFQKQIRTV